MEVDGDAPEAHRKPQRPEARADSPQGVRRARTGAQLIDKRRAHKASYATSGSRNFTNLPQEVLAIGERPKVGKRTEKRVRFADVLEVSKTSKKPPSHRTFEDRSGKCYFWFLVIMLLVTMAPGSVGWLLYLRHWRQMYEWRSFFQAHEHTFDSALRNRSSGAFPAPQFWPEEDGFFAEGVSRRHRRGNLGEAPQRQRQRDRDDGRIEDQWGPSRPTGGDNPGAFASVSLRHDLPFLERYFSEEGRPKVEAEEGVVAGKEEDDDRDGLYEQDEELAFLESEEDFLADFMREMEEHHNGLDELYREDAMFADEARAAAGEAGQGSSSGKKKRASRPRRSLRGASKGSTTRERSSKKATLGKRGPAQAQRKKRAEAQYGDSFEDGYEQHNEGSEKPSRLRREDVRAARMGGGGRNDLEDMVEAERQRLEKEKQQEQGHPGETAKQEELRRAAMDDGETLPEMPLPAHLRTSVDKAVWQVMSEISRGLWKVKRLIVRTWDADTRRVVRVLRCGRRGDHYCVLNLQTNPLAAFIDLQRKPSDEVIKKAYKRLALQLHPDKNRHPKAKVAFDLLQNAYETLRDAEKHRQFRIRRSFARDRRRRRVLVSAQTFVEQSWMVLESLVVGDLIIMLFLALLVV